MMACILLLMSTLCFSHNTVFICEDTHYYKFLTDNGPATSAFVQIVNAAGNPISGTWSGTITLTANGTNNFLVPRTTPNSQERIKVTYNDGIVKFAQASNVSCGVVLASNTAELSKPIVADGHITGSFSIENEDYITEYHVKVSKDAVNTIYLLRIPANLKKGTYSYKIKL